MNKEEFINEFNDWAKEEILERAFEICCKNIDLQQQNQELREQLEDIQLIKSTCGFCPYYKTKEKMENQQKEFIDYLEKEIKECSNYSKYIENKLQELKSRSAGKTYIANEIMKNEVAKKCFTEILSKYKSIIGSDINVGSIGGINEK